MIFSGKTIYAAAALAGLIGGLGGAYLASSQASGGQVSKGPWRYELQAQSSRASLVERAASASGNLTLERREVLEFIAASDSNGEALTSACAYDVSGTLPQSRYWSLATYDADGAAIGGKNVATGNSNQLRVALGGNTGLAIGSGEFRIVLHLYNPPAAIANDPSPARLPSIKRGACG